MRNLKRALSLGLTATMISGLMVMGSSAASYADVTSKQNEEAIEVLKTVGIMTGDENGKFNPEAKVTRNEMAVVMCNLLDYTVASYKGATPPPPGAGGGGPLCGRLLHQRHHQRLRRQDLRRQRHCHHRSGCPDAAEGPGLFPVQRRLRL